MGSSRYPSRDEPLSSSQLMKTLASLPQAPLIDEARALDWHGSALENDPHHAGRLVAKLQGFGGSDMGVLVYARRGVFHPFSDARTITRQKLLLDPVEKVGAHVRRGSAIESIAREHYRQDLAVRGGKVREDLLKKVQKYLAGDRHPDLAWLIGNIDEIVEENGRIYLVDYKSPSAGQFQELVSGGVQDYQVIQLHHYHRLAELAGVKVDGLRIYGFGAEEWRGHEREVAFNPDIVKEIEEAGHHFWNDFVLKGESAPLVMVNHPQALEVLSLVQDGSLVEESEALDRLRQALKGMGAEVFGHAMVKSEAEKARERLADEIRKLLPLKALPSDVSRVDLGPVRLKLDWDYHEDRLVEAVRNALSLMGQVDADIDSMLAADNFHHPASWSSESLIQILKERKGIDVEADPDFQAALIRPRRRRVDTLASLLRDLEKMLDEPVKWSDLVNFENSRLGVELVRTPATGFGKELREQTLKRVREATTPLAREVGVEHAEKMRQEHERHAQAASTPRPPKRRGPAP